MLELSLFGFLIMTYLMVAAKRTQALITGFSLQSFFLFLLTASQAANGHGRELYAVAALLLVIKVALVPFFLRLVVRKIRISDQLGLFVPPTLSLIVAVGLTYLAYLFAGRVIHPSGAFALSSFAVSLAVTLIGLFIMVSRLKALTQIIGLMVMENGLFLSAVALCGNMPFFVEIAIFFDVFVCVIILGVFVYRINQLFTHIDVDKLTVLKG